MIGRLSGIVVQKQPPLLVLDVNGVGYEVEAPMSTFYELPPEGQKANLLIHTHVREDALQLFGFATDIERRFFRTLIKISGVGAKMALTILSGINAETFASYVQQEDATALTKLPGVGKKTAQRLIVEMKDKLEKDVFAGAILPVMAAPASAAPAEMQAANPVEEAVTALIALGYKPPEASKMVRAVAKGADSTEELIRLALQAVVKA